jgi:ADP-ribose pyrophosphatase YjhB (NUDIX family)
MIDFKKQATSYFNHISKDCIHYLSLDCVVFGFHENTLKVLLLRWKGTERWSLPGGFIKKAESVDDAAQRCLRERTGLSKTYLQHFDIFGDVDRFPHKETWRKLGLEMPDSKWPERTISIGYYALVEYSNVRPSTDFLTDECSWHGIDEIPSLLFDHNDIIQVALEQLRRRLPWQPVKHLLPPTFTLPEFQKLHETILGRALDSRNFQRKVLASGILVRLNKTRTGTPYKSPFLYKFSTTKYSGALKEGTLTF